MSNDLMELNDVELNYIYFGDETDSDDASKNLVEDCRKHILYSQMWCFLTETKEVFSFY